MSDNLLDLGKRPILPPGEYGADGNAILDRYAYIDSRMEGVKADQLQIAVRTTNPEDGQAMVVRLFADPPRRQGTQAVKWFQQLGVPDDVLGNSSIDEEERAGLIKQVLEGQKVIVSVGIREWTDKDSGERGRANTVKNIVKLS